MLSIIQHSSKKVSNKKKNSECSNNSSFSPKVGRKNRNMSQEDDNRDILVWSTPNITMSELQLLPGRCHWYVCLLIFMLNIVLYCF